MPEYYEIKIKSHLDQRWSEWFAGLQITYLEGDETLLSGLLPDQGQFLSTYAAELRTETSRL